MEFVLQTLFPPFIPSSHPLLRRANSQIALEHPQTTRRGSASHALTLTDGVTTPAAAAARAPSPPSFPSPAFPSSASPTAPSSSCRRLWSTLRYLRKKGETRVCQYNSTHITRYKQCSITVHQFTTMRKCDRSPSRNTQCCSQHKYYSSTTTPNTLTAFVMPYPRSQLECSVKMTQTPAWEHATTSW